MIEKVVTGRFDTLSAPVLSPVCSYTHLKNFLKLNGIRYGRLSVISNHTLRLHFSNLSNMLYADRVPIVDIFDSNNFTNWIQQNT